jgi:hypothetical protein
VEAAAAEPEPSDDDDVMIVDLDEESVDGTGPIADDLLGPPRSPEAPADSDDDFTSLTLAELHESQGAHEEAARLYERLLARNPSDADLRRSLERCRARIEGRPMAAAAASRSSSEAPSRPRWEPVRPRSAPEASPAPGPIPSPSEPVDDLLGPPLASAARPAEAARLRSASAPTPPRAAHARRTLRELERWLAACRSVRQ